jgi:acyl-ACP thioesterase
MAENARPRTGGRLDALVPAPAEGRIYTSSRRIRLSDTDADGRLRLDAVARYLQDVASDDVDETGWGAPEHLWVVRRTRIDVLAPFLRDRSVELATWCSGLAPSAAGRRTSLRGDAGGQVEVDSAWIHLGTDGRPARLDDRFGIYRRAAGGRRVMTRLTLPNPPADSCRKTWQLRTADVDVMGHLNNAIHWAAVEELLPASGVDPRSPFQAVVEYRRPIDLGDELALATFADDGDSCLALTTADGVRAVARLRQRVTPAGQAGSS